MAKTKYDKETQAMLVYMCEGRRLLHTGDREVLIARLVESDKSKEPEPEPTPTVD